MRNIRLLIAYDGTAYQGWQIQPAVPTIQGEIEKHLQTIHTEHITLHGAGRTDSGVHALGMVAHFHTPKNMSATAFKQSLNSMLPEDIRILAAEEAPLSFHARFSAKHKTYLYAVYNGDVQLPHTRFTTLHIRSELNRQDMDECLQMLVGTHDFGCFETAGSRDKTVTEGRGSIRTIKEAKIDSSTEDYLVFSISGDGFLRHMVRNIVGTVLEVGLARRTVASFEKAFLSRKRSSGGATAPAHGLTLERITY